MCKIQQNKLIEIIYLQIKQLFAEAEKYDWSMQDFAGRIWLGTIKQSIPEVTLCSILFEKALNISAVETYKLIDELVEESKTQKEEGVERAIKLLVDGLVVIGAKD